MKRALPGAILVLAAAILIAAATLSRQGGEVMPVGIIVGCVGAYLLFRGLKTDGDSKTTEIDTKD